MRVLIFGGTGMVGSGVLVEALASPRVTSVVVVGRSSTGRTHSKFEEITHDDFFDYTAIRDRLTGFDACFFCLGASAAGMADRCQIKARSRSRSIVACFLEDEMGPPAARCRYNQALQNRSISRESNERCKFVPMK